MMRFVLGAMALLLLAGLATAAEETKVGDLTISALWIRATPPKAPSAADYFTISNSGKEADRLVAASSTLADKAELHQMAMKGGVMTMRPVKDGITIPAGGSVTLAPDGLHVMFTGLGGFRGRCRGRFNVPPPSLATAAAVVCGSISSPSAEQSSPADSGFKDQLRRW